jgi:hypothetical protein
MNLLIDFLNVKEFSAEILLELHQKHGLFHSLWGQRQGYEDKLLSSGFLPGTIFFFDSGCPIAAELKEKGPEFAAMPGDEKFKGLFDYLKVLQGVWAERIEATITEGPDLDLLNESEAKAKVVFEPGENRWSVKPRYWLQGARFEDYLNFDYLHIFLTGQGEVLKKLRICENQDCGKWFIYNRPKQRFCCDACRKSHWYETEVDKNERARIARQKRENGFWQ